MEHCFSLPLLLDGATGTELQKRGMPRGVCTEDWILEHPAALLELQRAYVDAGVRVLTAPTFGTTERLAEDYRALVALSRQAAGGKALVAGDIGPGGASPAVRAAALRAAGVDLYLVETMLSAKEAAAAVEALRAEEPQKPVLVSFYPHKGLEVAEAYAAMAALGVDGFGFNCAEPEAILAALERLPKERSLPLLAMPGFAAAPPRDGLACHVAALAALGVRIFGGCCGTGPMEMNALRKKLDEKERKM